MAKKRSSTRAESQRICNIMPSRGTDKDWPYETAIASEAVTAVAALKLSRDETKLRYLSPGEQTSAGRRLAVASQINSFGGLGRQKLSGR